MLDNTEKTSGDEKANDLSYYQKKDLLKSKRAKNS